MTQVVPQPPPEAQNCWADPSKPGLWAILSLNPGSDTSYRTALGQALGLSDLSFLIYKIPMITQDDVDKVLRPGQLGQDECRVHRAPPPPPRPAPGAEAGPGAAVLGGPNLSSRFSVPHSCSASGGSF